MRMAPDQLVPDPARHRGEVETSGLLGHARVKYHLKQQVTELVAQPIQVAASDGVRDLVRLLDRERGDRDKILLAIPRTAAFRIAQHSYQLQQRLEFVACGTQGASSSVSWSNTSRRFASMPAVAPQMLYRPNDSSQVSTSTSRIVRRLTW